MGSPDEVKSIVLFDGVCNLCNESVLFVIKRDPDAKFKFATLQSPFAQQRLKEHRADPKRLYSVVLLRGEKMYERSRAALEIARGLNGLWPLLYVFVIVPPFIRNGVYDFIASHRYKWFGRKEECMIPTPELKSRFID
jgi:predicted DCC family thiol-disulfide oxidoreductase YuxK